MELITQNSKLKKTSKKFGKRVFNFGIPAFADPESGKRTCPFAGSCAKICYARKGAYAWGNVKPAYIARYNATKQDDFVDVMTKEIQRKRVEFMRIHDSGDYYSREYIAKWFEIARRNPNVKFYSYTKSIPLFKEVNLPENFDIIYSEGSTVDNLIDTNTDRHSRIFDSAESLSSAGYADASEYDLYATKWFNKNNKVGLVIH